MCRLSPLLLLIPALASNPCLAHDFPDAPGLRDADRDGVDDGLEQQLLERFLPRLRINQGDCAGLPLELVPGLTEPKFLAANGTLYGQVFPVQRSGHSGALLEVHYYHLWAQDCGRLGHPLDAEYVSALLKAGAPQAAADQWRAVYWFAAAHEGTLCDAGNGALAWELEAEDRGPEVWISAGKHASFLSQALCARIGCGGDRCEAMEQLAATQVINLGEPGAAINGADWAGSRSWPLAGKMASVFDDPARLRFEELDGEGPQVMTSPPPPTKALVLTGNVALGTVETTQRHTGSALATGGSAARLAAKKTVSAVGRSLRAVGRWLGID